MSSKASKLKKNINNSLLQFEKEMYTSTLGSLVISGYIFSNKKPTPQEINKKWKKLPKMLDDIPTIDDEKFIDKTLNLFEIEKPTEFPIAMIQSDFNVLFMPYVNGVIYPIREDKVLPQTAKKGKVYTIDFEGNECGEN